MNKKQVLVYINNNYKHRSNLLDQLDKWNINYETRNVAENQQYLRELQDKGIYGTPVTFIDGNPILGFQKDKMKHALGLENRFN
ncbi:glutaredoxin family protein [Virgibacillus dakarensis]|uniref:glutaredoxin family protein n=1 Tax=Virgibacillus dakarensis TaxID=1917889 RepID=UPI000B444FDD|nr:glutaredoxin domain-containing protein [Virgibacillus dakarensis]MBT2218322.1 glutaredoxin family protein [Virgibacillus dakarensis]MTW85680.1 glutaredoxin family protein [Virgibacillus dakarensis]